MIKTLQDILNEMALNFIANGTAYLDYRKKGRSTAGAEYNLQLLYNLYWAFPYFNQDDPQADINRAQLIINITQL